MVVQQYTEEDYIRPITILVLMCSCSQRGNLFMMRENEYFVSPDGFTAEINQGENLSNSKYVQRLKFYQC